MRPRAALLLLCLCIPAGAAASGTGEVILGFAPGSLPELRPGQSLLGFPVVKVVPRGGFLVLRAPDLLEVRRAAGLLPGLAYVEENARRRASVIPDDARYGQQYGPGMMGFPQAWGAVGFGSPAVSVAVLDTGLLAGHEDFEPGRLAAGHDYVNGDSDPEDDCGHGTHVTGTIGATTDNALGVAGMSQARLLPMKVLSQLLIIDLECGGSDADVAEAIYDSADQGARVISMSLGGPTASNTLQDAVADAWSRGVLLVAAAGNGGPCLDCVDYPARYESVIAVAALDASKAKATYSSSGPKVEIAAPGSGVLSTYSDGGYRSLSGTSMATPHVSGALALALSCRPEVDAASLRGLLQQTAEDLGLPGRDNDHGYGLARADALVQALGACSGGPGAPLASFTAAVSGLSVSVDGSSSSDPQDDPLSFAWDFGDGATASGVQASHTYAAGGTYTIALEVSDGHGGTDTALLAVTVSQPGDPDPATPSLRSGESESVALTGTGDDAHYKIFVPAVADAFDVQMTGPPCGLLGCDFDADLFVRFGQRASDQDWDCRPFLQGSNESCSFPDPAPGWWYVRVRSFQGSGQATLVATLSLAPGADSDGDGVLDDGDGSGLAGDGPCQPGQTDACDDNCARASNPGQQDAGGLGAAPPDGIGDACQCGDVTGNGAVNGQDGVFIVRRGLGYQDALFAVPGNCDVTGNGVCNGQDGFIVTRAALGYQDPLFGQSCPNAR